MEGGFNPLRKLRSKLPVWPWLQPISLEVKVEVIVVNSVPVPLVTSGAFSFAGAGQKKLEHLVLLCFLFWHVPVNSCRSNQTLLFWKHLARQVPTDELECWTTSPLHVHLALLSIYPSCHVLPGTISQAISRKKKGT